MGTTEVDFHECEVKLAEALGRTTVQDSTWGHLVRLGFVEAAIREGHNSTEWDTLVVEARKYERDTRAADPGTNLPPDARVRTAPETVAVRLDEYTVQRAEAFSEVAGTLAARWAAVREFRDVHLGGVEAHLTDEEARRWVYEGVAPRPALDDLREVSRQLAWAFRWRIGDAQWFVLTGYVPVVRPVSVTVHLNSSRDAPNYLNRRDFLEDSNFMVDTADIVITAEPWVDSRIVSRVFKDVQKQMIGGDNRKKTTKTLDAVRFVARQLGTGSVRWEQLKELWNRSQADTTRHYRSRNALWQAFNRFLRPRYEKPKYEPYEPTPWQNARREALEQAAESRR
jgi:hypothetical protein